MSLRNLVVVLGDQLDPDSAALEGFDPDQDAVWMAEVDEETTHVWAHKLRIAYFLAAMRHHRDALRDRGWTVRYHALGPDRAQDRGAHHGAILAEDLAELAPERVIVVEPGDLRVQDHLQKACGDVELEIRPDAHFMCSIAEFEAWAKGKKSLLLESFYRTMRKKHGVLMEPDGSPTGGDWNYDADNRKSFGKDGPQGISSPPEFEVDEVSQQVLQMVAERYADHPGRLDGFARLPVTPAQAEALLEDFVAQRLPAFGDHQDAMWTEEAFLNHSLLSAPLNLRLIGPRACVEAAVQAYADGDAPLNAVEGFVRQILGWREYIRGVYYLHMPEYAEMNALAATNKVPSFFWDGETDMACVADAMQSVLQHGYAHHIQRLMVLGLFSQLYGVHPKAFHEWHLAMYVDAVDWVSLPNALGMSQYGDGGIVGSKPYCASGNYISKMSNYCKGCRYKPKAAVGDEACPFTTFYWEFLDRNRERLEGNHRMGFQMKNLDRKDEATMEAIRERARALRRSMAARKVSSDV